MEWFPSLFAAHPLDLKAGLDRIIQAGIRQVHLDCMDGHFVPNITFGPSVIKAVRNYAPQLFRSVHLMLVRPEDFIEKYIESGAQRIFIHIEIDSNSLVDSVKILQASKIEWGFAINPRTSVACLEAYLRWVEQTSRLLIMSVSPGFSGQAFMPQTYKRIQAIKKLFPTLKLCVDGGITLAIADNLAKLGVASCVRGSDFFKEKSK